MTNGNQNRSNSNGCGSGGTTVSSSFEAFFYGWLRRQQHYLDELLSAQQCRHDPPYEDLKDLIRRLLLHYQHYYEEKSRLVERDVFLVFCPSWFSSLERSMFWIAGFKPALAFRLVSDSVTDLSREQDENMQRLIVETRVEEKILSDELARVQEGVAAPPLLEIARRRAQQQRGEGEEIPEEEASVESLRKAMEEVVGNADMLRITTAARVVEILDPLQNLRFFTAAAELMLTVRNLGWQKNAEK